MSTEPESNRRSGRLVDSLVEKVLNSRDCAKPPSGDRYQNVTGKQASIKAIAMKLSR